MRVTAGGEGRYFTHPGFIINFLFIWSPLQRSRALGSSPTSANHHFTCFNLSLFDDPLATLAGLDKYRWLARPPPSACTGTAVIPN